MDDGLLPNSLTSPLGDAPLARMPEQKFEREDAE
jgi:hypothetical protein